MSAQLKIAVIGGGLGGLSFALACLRKGIKTDVYEQAAAFREIGNGVALQTNATVLVNDFLDLKEGYTQITADLSGQTYMSYADYATGNEQGSLPMPREVPVEDRPHRVPRSDFLDLLRRDLPKDSLHTGCRLKSLERGTDGVYTLTFESGATATADVVVGADGIHSTCRQLLQRSLGLPIDNPVYSGQVCYRALIPQSAFEDEPEIHQQLFGDGHRCINFRGPGRHFLFFAVGKGGRLGNVVAFIPEDRALSESWTAKGPVDDLRAELQGWCPAVQKIVDEMDKISPKALKQALYYREVLEQWHDGGFILIGDAAHPILPHQGQGTGMAVEDAVALAMCLDGADRQTLEERLTIYSAVRKPRTDRILASSIAMGKVSSSATLTEAERKMMSERDWIWNYDVRIDVAEKLTATE